MHNAQCIISQLLTLNCELSTLNSKLSTLNYEKWHVFCIK